METSSCRSSSTWTGTGTGCARLGWCRVFRELLGASAQDILVMGSGIGEPALVCAALGHRMLAIDRSRPRVALSRAWAHAVGLPAAFLVGDAGALPCADGSFDVVHASHLLCTAPRPDRALAEWLRVLRPGGRIVLAAARGTRSRRRWWAPGRPTRGGSGRPPFEGGLRRWEAETYLHLAKLLHVESWDLLWLHRKARRELPWYHRRASAPMREYSLVWGRKP